MSAHKLFDTSTPLERAVLVGASLPDAAIEVAASLDELERLVETAGASVVGRMTQTLQKPYSKTYLGSGKIGELSELVGASGADVVVFDDELTPSQQANIERMLGSHVKVVDRCALVLDIFGLHATTREGKLQVQLAQLQYLLPRLRGMWSHLANEQSRGGIGGRFGQGESQLEIDRRLVRDKISALRRQLALLSRQRGTQAKLRARTGEFRIALVGYTNAGKSSLLNALTGSNVLAQDKLFATLDPTTRQLGLPGGRRVTLTDTVGFVQKLPHELVEAFKSTLAEAVSADLILRVVDISDDAWEFHLHEVERVLNEIGASEIPSLFVFNKCDMSHGMLPAEYACDPHSLMVSARTGEGLQALLDMIDSVLRSQDACIQVQIPYERGDVIARARRVATVVHESAEPEGFEMLLSVPERYLGTFTPFLASDLPLSSVQDRPKHE